jgi:hypothetical protein
VTRAGLALVVVAAIVGGGLYLHQSTQSSSDCTDANALAVHVAAAPDIAPVVRDVAARWEAATPTVDGRCVRVSVDADTFATQVKAVYSGGPSADPTQLPAMWITDSSASVGAVLATDQSLFADASVSIASSPVVLAVAGGKSPASAVAKGGTLDMAGLVKSVTSACATGQPPAVQLGFDNPATDPAALAAVGWMAGGITDKDCLIESLRTVPQSPDATSLLNAVGHNVDAVPSSEQAVRAHNASGAGAKLDALVPNQGGVMLDYPAAIVANLSADIEAAAEQFRAQLAAPANRDIAGRYGFRTPDGTAGPGFTAAPGGSTAKAVATPITDPKQIDALLKVWGAANTPARVLTLIDTSPTMTKITTGTTTRLQLLRTMAGNGLGLFQHTDKVGIWAFGGAASANTKGYTSVVEPDTLDGTQLNKISSAIGAAKATGSNSCGLYPALAAAYKSMLANYATGRSNTLIVFTDTTASCGQTSTDLASELQGLADANRPVALIILSIGSDADQKTLTSLTQSVGGTIFQLTPSSDIKRVFLESLMTLLGG